MMLKIWFVAFCFVAVVFGNPEGLFNFSFYLVKLESFLLGQCAFTSFPRFFQNQENFVAREGQVLKQTFSRLLQIQ